MEPVSGHVFVKKTDRPNTFSVVDSNEARYLVTQATDVKVCKPGDYILFTSYRNFSFEGEDIWVVPEGDIIAVKPAETL